MAAKSNKDFELTELFTAFDQLEDPRSSINRLHPLSSVLSIAVLAVLCGADGPTSIRYWAEARQEFLERFIELPNGLPSRDVFRRVLCALQPAAFQQCFNLWIQSMSAALEAWSNESNQEPEKRHLAIDGKTLKGSRNDSKGIGPLHLVSVWMSEKGITLAQVPTGAKSNEITAIPQVLQLIDVRGAIITIDAMGTQTAIVKEVVDRKGDVIICLKGNQGNLYNAVSDFVDHQIECGFSEVHHEVLMGQQRSSGMADWRRERMFTSPFRRIFPSKKSGFALRVLESLSAKRSQPASTACSEAFTFRVCL